MLVAAEAVGTVVLDYLRENETSMNQQQEYNGTRQLLAGIVLAVITFWLFANSLINVIPTLQTSFGSYLSTISIAVSLTALFSGMFVVEQVV